ncbi:hypothetical protein PTTG_29720 [Puccinia triticina 1-1 BBBD Race 1]|uniref:Uncharacterized protein n=1 Tax=Puccinia triticina (isolate 1-1 / race 1 (BBBD)) TaxID=630390 RepID=A0A180G287_PUCT1|nr:hypothetical protein PTTG_29720 [Puccinia triticina 1-1 BBBD Race 1]
MRGSRPFNLSTRGLVQQDDDTDTLGFTPDLTPIIEESKEIKPRDDFVPEDVILEEDNEQEVHSDAEKIGDSSEDKDLPEEPKNSKNKVDAILKKVDFVIQQITCSAAKRSEYNTWCKRLDYNGPSLIAWYGIRWNIKFQSRDRGYQARKIIRKLLENERDRQEREGGKNYYNKMEISQEEWDVVKKLNNMLGEFYFLTKKMEGDHSSACLMISEYWYIKAYIKEKMKTIAPNENEFQKMLQAMSAKTEKYLN